MYIRAVDPIEYKAGGYIFYIHPFGGDASLEIFGDLQKALVPLIGKAITGFGGDTDAAKLAEAKKIDDLLDAKIDLASIGAALANATQHLDGQELVRLSRKLRGASKIFFIPEEDHNAGRDSEELKDDSYNAITRGRPEIIFGLMKKIIEVNYQSFFSSLQGAFGTLTPLLELMKNAQNRPSSGQDASTPATTSQGS